MKKLFMVLFGSVFSWKVSCLYRNFLKLVHSFDVILPVELHRWPLTELFTFFFSIADLRKNVIINCISSSKETRMAQSRHLSPSSWSPFSPGYVLRMSLSLCYKGSFLVSWFFFKQIHKYPGVFRIFRSFRDF